MLRKVIFDKKNVLVIGGAGFIGSHLCDELVKTAKVICVDNFSTGFESNIDHLLANPNFKFIKHDMADPLILEDLVELSEFKVEFQGIQEVYNMACPTSPIYFEKNRIANILANSYVVKNALDLAVKYDAKIMHFSSSVIYGGRRSDDEKINEDDFGIVDPLSERASYDEGKRFAECIVKTYKDVYKIDAKIVRLFRVYGPRMPLDEGHMIPDFISNALDNKDLIIFGDRNFKSSYCYVSDAIDGITKFMESSIFGPLNLGSDVDVSVADIAEKIIKETGSESKIIYADSMLFLSSLCLPDIVRSRDLLGWMPLVTLDNGLRKTIEALRANKGLKKMKL